jgi:outer membrane receptor for ferric coprogen and ferric-rhodotorulic acid
MLTDISTLQQGAVLDKFSGKWQQLKTPSGDDVRFPDLKSAYEHMQTQKGKRGEELLKAQQQAAQSMMHAMTRRADPVELTSENQGTGDVGGMTEDRAMQIIERYTPDSIMIRARKNFNDPLVQEYNKALKKLGHAVLDKEDLL